MAFTDLAVRSLKEGVHFDLKTPAFGLRVGAQKKTWLVVRGKGRIQTVIGHYPEMGLSEARLAARRLLVSAVDEKPPSLTFSEIRARYLAEHTGRPRTKKELERLLTKKFAKLDAKPASDITDADIASQIASLAPSEALHAFRAARALFRWATRPPRRYVPHSPLEGYAPPSTEKSRDRVLSPNELKAIWNACPDDAFGCTVKLLILTGQRKGEIRNIVMEGDLATLKGIHTKNGRPHAFPIPLEASKLLTTPLVWGGWGKSKAKLDNASGVSNWTLHDLRRTYATIHAQLGTPPYIIEKLLNHVTGQISGVAATYNRYQYLPEMRDAVHNYEKHITKLLE